jgi:DNA helicase-2/ATP-dependent DNA helicase PcrA
MKILLAGPGTGKTTNIQTLIKENFDAAAVLVISFTNATVDDLKKALVPIGVNKNSCMTLHKFAVKHNHDISRHVLDPVEIDELDQISERTGIGFNDLCNFLSATTFDQMVTRFVTFAKANPEYLKERLSEYSVLIVDEYQDFNTPEQNLIDLLVPLMDAHILGDDDQCIYDFKDASNEKIIQLFGDAAHEKMAHEHKCYRCPDIVVERATRLIKNNQKRVAKDWKMTGKKGNLIVRQFATSAASARYVAEEAKKILDTSEDDEVLILSPVGFYAEPVIQELNAAGIDHKNFFLKRISVEIMEKGWVIKTLFGDYTYLNLVLLGYRRLSNRVKFYALIKMHYDSGQHFADLFAFLSKYLPDEIKVTYQDVDTALADLFFNDLKELYGQADGKTVSEKLEKMFILVDDKDKSRVKVMSIHKSKGLGADHVFMVGLVEGVIPNRVKGNDTIESQRRLFFVGMTRAKKTLHLLSSVGLEGKYVNRVSKGDFKFDVRSRMYKGRVSRFIEEIQ